MKGLLTGLSVAVLVLSAVCPSVVQGDDPTSDWPVCEDKAGRFSVRYPPEWTCGQNSEHIIFLGVQQWDQSWDTPEGFAAATVFVAELPVYDEDGNEKTPNEDEILSVRETETEPIVVAKGEWPFAGQASYIEYTNKSVFFEDADSVDTCITLYGEEESYIRVVALTRFKGPISEEERELLGLVFESAEPTSVGTDESRTSLTSTREATSEATSEATLEIDLEVTSYSVYGDDSHSNFYGEVVNRSDFPLQDVEIVLSLLDENDGVVTVGTTRSAVDLVPANGKCPFEIRFTVGKQHWHDVEFLFQAEPYEEERFRGALPLGLKTEGANFTKDSVWHLFHLGGRVINAGDKDVGSVELIGTAYDESHKVIDYAVGEASLDYIKPGGYSPFDLEFQMLDEEPFDFDILVQGIEVD